MFARHGQFQDSYKRNWRQQQCGSYEECYESHGQRRNQTEQCCEKLTQQEHSNRIRKRQATVFGHLWEEEKLEHLFRIAIGIIEGKRRRGKQQRCWMD